MQVHHGLVPFAPFINNERDKRDDEDEERPTNPCGSKPIVFLSFVEDDLQASDPHRKQAKPDSVELAGLGVLDVRRIMDEAADHVDGQNPDRDVDVKGITPAISVGKPTAEGGADNRSHYYSEGKNRHGHTAFARWEAFQQNCLRKRLECTSAGALNDPGNQDEAQRRRSPAEKRGNRKDDDARDEEVFASK